MATRNTTRNTQERTRATTPTRTVEKSWKDITGKMVVFGNEFTGKNGPYMSYSSSVGAKNKDGDYDNIYYNVKFAGGTHPDIDGAFEINIKSGFLSLTVGKNDIYPTVVIMEYDLIN